MRSRERVPTELRDEGQVKVKLFHQPIHARTDSLRQHLGERHRVCRRFGVPDARRALDDIIFKLISAVGNVQPRLRLRQRSVNPTRRLRAVPAQEGTFVEQHDARAVFDDGVRRGQARETTADDDDLISHVDGEFDDARRRVMTTNTRRNPIAIIFNDLAMGRRSRFANRARHRDEILETVLDKRRDEVVEGGESGAKTTR